MILSNVAIQKAIDDGFLVIDPEPTPRRLGSDGIPCPYQTSAVDLRLGRELNVFKGGASKAPIKIDLSEIKFTKLPKDVFDRTMLGDGDSFILPRGKLVLAKTLERVHLPIRKGGPTLAARIEGKSSYARCGMLVHFTAPTIHAGYDGTITLEIMNHGEYDIVLKPNIFICQLIVEQVQGRPFENVSQFQGQTTPTGM